MSKHLSVRLVSRGLLKIGYALVLTHATWAKPPITDGEADPVMLDLDLSLIHI